MVSARQSSCPTLCRDVLSMSREQPQTWNHAKAADLLYGLDSWSFQASDGSVQVGMYPMSLSVFFDMRILLSWFIGSRLAVQGRYFSAAAELGCMCLSPLQAMHAGWPAQGQPSDLFGMRTAFLLRCLLCARPQNTVGRSQPSQLRPTF